MELLHMDSWQDERLAELHAYAQDADVIAHLQDIKQEKKREWCTHIRNKQRVAINPNSIFDTQVKRLHEYKRQQMNALWIIYKLKEIRKGNLPKRPITCIFGAKAAPAYTIAKDIIHVLLCLQDIIEHDARVSPYLQVCFIENYNVSEAELIIPASDISEQISLASKEASGTGNMKFMLNGALTLEPGTVPIWRLPIWLRKTIFISLEKAVKRSLRIMKRQITVHGIIMNRMLCCRSWWII